MIVLEDKKLRRNFIFVNSIRISVLSALLFIAVFLVLFDTPFPGVPIIIALSSAFVLSWFYFPLYKRVDYRFAIYLQLIVDITLITVLVYFSESFRSPFYFLYILPIIVSSFFLTRRDTIYIASFAFIIFGVLSNLVYLKVIPLFPESADVEISLGNFIYNLTMSFIAFCTVAILSSYYFERLRKTDAQLKNVQESLRDMVLLNNTVMEKMENGFVTCDSRGSIISYNQKARSMLKLGSKSNILQLMSMHANTMNLDALSQPWSRYYVEIEMNNQVLGISVSVIEKIYSFDKLYVFIITDLTEKRAIEEQLKKKEHLALIGEMSAGIAHEIRNPLASISGSVQFLSKELKLEKAHHQNLMEIIIKESNRLSQSIEDFLDFTRSSPLELTDIDISSMIEDVLGLVTLNSPEITVIKKYSPGYIIRADMKKINQVLWNLINNAVKAVSGTGSIEINVFRKEDQVFLSIKDDGIGIEKEELPRIFTPFYSKFTSGFGLGMALVKRIIDEHNFKISIDSQKNIGTEVTVCLRAA